MNRKFFSQKAFAFSFMTAMAMVALEVSAWIAAFSFTMLFGSGELRPINGNLFQEK